MARHERSASPTAATRRGREIRAAPHSGSGRQHDDTRLQGSDADALAPLPAPRSQDGAARAGPHAQSEAMRLGPAAVVRLESTLTHGSSRCSTSVVNAVTIYGSLHYSARTDLAKKSAWSAIVIRHYQQQPTRDFIRRTGIIHLTG